MSTYQTTFSFNDSHSQNKSHQPNRSISMIAQIEEQGKAIPTDANEEETSQSKPTVGIDRIGRQQLGATVLPSTKLLITRLQEDALSRGWKKPKIGELIDEAVQELAKSRGV